MYGLIGKMRAKPGKRDDLLARLHVGFGSDSDFMTKSAVRQLFPQDRTS